jgi:hypothetical protein
MSEFAVLNVTSDPSCPGRVSTDLQLRQHLFAESDDSEPQQPQQQLPPPQQQQTEQKQFKMLAVPASLAKPSGWPTIERFAQTGFQYADDGDVLLRAGSDGSDTQVLMSDVHILVLDESRFTRESRKNLRKLEQADVLPSPPPLLFDIELVRHGVRLLASSHKQLIDARQTLKDAVMEHCSVELEITAKAEAPFASTNRMLDRVYDTAIDGVERLFVEAGHSTSTVAAQRLWILGKETRLFEPFLYKNAHFTKTGSGQT